ncbi:MAG: hypothetical protein ABIN04_15220 [Ginsengibacter sp.]
MARHRIYGLFDPSKKEIFYIGQTSYIPYYRLLNHICASKDHLFPVSLRIKEMVSNGIKPKVFTLKEFEINLCRLTNKNHGLFFENIFIKEYSSLGTLLNIVGNPLYDRKTKIFKEPNLRKELKFVDGKYYIDSDAIKYLHQEPYNPFKNERFLSKIR